MIHRDGLKVALSGRDDVLLEPILRLLLKYVADPRFGELVCDVARVLIGEFVLISYAADSDTLTEMYKPVIGQAPLIDSLFVRLHKKVMVELRFQAELQRTSGALSMIMSSSLASLPS